MGACFQVSPEKYFRPYSLLLYVTVIITECGKQSGRKNVKSNSGTTEVVDHGLSRVLHAPMMHGASLVMLQNRPLSSIRLVQQADCQRIGAANVFFRPVGALVGTTSFSEASNFRSYAAPNNVLNEVCKLSPIHKCICDWYVMIRTAKHIVDPKMRENLSDKSFVSHVSDKCLGSIVLAPPKINSLAYRLP